MAPKSIITATGGAGRSCGLFFDAMFAAYVNIPLPQAITFGAALISERMYAIGGFKNPIRRHRWPRNKEAPPLVVTTRSDPFGSMMSPLAVSVGAVRLLRIGDSAVGLPQLESPQFGGPAGRRPRRSGPPVRAPVALVLTVRGSQLGAPADSAGAAKGLNERFKYYRFLGRHGAVRRLDEGRPDRLWVKAGNDCA